MINGRGIFCEMIPRRMWLNLTDDKSTLVQVMAWCRQATSHYLSQCWPSSMSPYSVTRPQWVKEPGHQRAWHWSNQLKYSFSSIRLDKTRLILILSLLMLEKEYSSLFVTAISPLLSYWRYHSLASSYQSINLLWPGDAIWRHGSRSTLALVMARCLTAPSHYLNQCWLIIREVPWHSSGCIIIRRSEETHQ